MSRSISPQSLPVFILSLCLIPIVHAAYLDFFFTTSEIDWKCPGIPWGCVPPAACAYDTLTDKHYCCDGSRDDDVCWVDSLDECAADSLECGPSDTRYCCLGGREMCTKRTGQINVCWATEPNPITELNLSPTVINETFSSLSAASPSASSLSFQLSDFISTTTAATQRSTAPTTSTSATETPYSSPDPNFSDDSDSSLSSGGIAGVVIGAIAGVALIVVGAFVLWRRRNKYARQQRQQGHGQTEPSAYTASQRLDVKYGGPPVHEMYNDNPPVEMDARNGNERAVEMEGSPAAGHAGGRRDA